MSVRRSSRHAIRLALFLAGLQATLASAGSVVVGTTTYATPGNLGSFAAGTQLAVGDALSNSSTTATLSFYDDFVFTLSAPASLSELAASIQILPVSSITGFSESLYAGATTVYSASGSNPLAGAPLESFAGPAAMSFGTLAAGTYTLQVSGVIGKATTVLGVLVPDAAAYGTLVAVSAVPEPASLALLATGCLLLAGVHWGRRRPVRG